MSRALNKGYEQKLLILYSDLEDNAPSSLTLFVRTFLVRKSLSCGVRKLADAGVGCRVQ